MLTTTASSSVLAQRLHAARANTDELLQLLKPTALYERPVAERHRFIFYLGHLEAFDWNQISRAGLGAPSFHPEFDRLFEFGIDPAPGKAAADQPSDWPRVEEVRRYNAIVREKLDAALGDAPELLLHIAIEHRLMHAETLAYLLHHMPYDAKVPGRWEPHTAARRLEPRMIDIPAGVATLGQRDGDFGWDNEFAEHRVPVPGFSISRHKVTNGDYLGFVREGGEPPHFWTQHQGEWFYRGMFAETPLPLDHPVYATHREAARYAKWAGKSLPTEAQFHRAAYGTPFDLERPFPWGSMAPEVWHGNFDFRAWDPVSVRADREGDSAFGVSQLAGNGWEWTATLFGPFRGFRAFPTYPGYSQNFFDGEHYVLKGASPRTAACFLRRSFRNWFRPDYPYMYATFRLVDN